MGFCFIPNINNVHPSLMAHAKSRPRGLEWSIRTPFSHLNDKMTAGHRKIRKTKSGIKQIIKRYLANSTQLKGKQLASRTNPDMNRAQLTSNALARQMKTKSMVCNAKGKQRP